MKKFECPTCGKALFFNSLSCLNCQTDVSFSPGELNFVSTQGHNDCSNRAQFGVCNWLAEPGQSLCLACATNDVIPDQSIEGNQEKWSLLEGAKRRLVFTCLRLGIPLDGVTFCFLASTPEQPVTTGHDSGVITINIREADPVKLESTKQDLNEKYRTLVGHFRHEFGHFYWDKVVFPDPAALKECRRLFGDEREDYQASLEQHYAEGTTEAEAPAEFVSAYATMHPWEDWAETFAHYLHLRDVLETAEEFGLAPRPVSPTFDFDHGLLEWQRLSVAFNEINRSMGLGDLYPFIISEAVVDKLRFVDSLVEAKGSLAASR